MNDLRSLEGVGLLLSEKMAQSRTRNARMQSRKTLLQRAESVPKLQKMSTPSAIKQGSIQVSNYFEAPLAAAITQSAVQGFSQKSPFKDSPVLSKSHSGFASNEVPYELRKFKSAPAVSPSSESENAPKSPSKKGDLKFSHSANNVVECSTPSSPTEPQQIPTPPNPPPPLTAISSDARSSEQSLPDSFITHSFSICKGNGPTLRFDLSDLDLDGGNSCDTDTLRGASLHGLWLLEDQESDNFGRSGSNNFLQNSNPPPRPGGLETILSQESHVNGNGVEARSPQSPHPPGVDRAGSGNKTPFGGDGPPKRLSSIYSNNSLFTLRSDDTDFFSSTESLVDKNTRLNAQISSSPPSLTDAKEIDVLDLKEDFMEHHTENRGGFNCIGSGASGIVRKAFHFRSCKLVAIKQLKSKENDQMRAFKKEAGLYKHFEDNPNIPDILGFGKDGENGSLMMCLEYMDLMSTDTLGIDSNDTMSMEQKELAVGHIVYGTLNALHAMHNELYIHNDIKPANILANHFGEIKLSDLGTVTKLKDGTKRCRKNNGTQKYQAPEKMINSKGSSYTMKNDIWSLGISAYELFFGDKYTVNDETLYCIKPPKLKAKKCGLSKECCKFINECLTKDDRKRPSAMTLLNADWMKKIKSRSVAEKWSPWYIEIEDIMDDEKEESLPSQVALLDAIDSLSPKSSSKKVMDPVEEAFGGDDNSSKSKPSKLSKSSKSIKNIMKKSKKSGKSDKKKKNVNFSSDSVTPLSQSNTNTVPSKVLTPRPAEQNEDLFFMITSMVIYYLTQSVDFEREYKQHGKDGLDRHKSTWGRENSDSAQSAGKHYSDEERIANMAKYAHCTKEMVREKIRVTVGHIKTQMNKMEMMHGL